MGTTAALTPTRAAALAAMAMRRRPTKTVHDLQLSGPQRALATFKQLQPRLAGRYADAALLVVAQQRKGRPLGVCGWHLARALAKRWALPAPRWTADHRALLGKPCQPACRAQIDPKPRPKPKAAAARPRETPARRSAPPGRRLPATPAEVTARLGGPRLTPTAALQRRRVIHYVSGAAAATLARAGRPVAPDTPANRAAAARQYQLTGSPNFTPAGMGWPATPPTRRGRR
jgi:hypothetical protein